jgi:hypothetical protein
MQKMIMMTAVTNTTSTLLSNLKQENMLLKQKLKEKQQCINKTNAYWKKKMYNS